MPTLPTSAPRRDSPGAVWWILIAVATLAVAGGWALALVVGRAPVVSATIDDPAFFRRALTAHVVLALWGWFVTYGAGLRLIVDGPGSRTRHHLTLGLTVLGLTAIGVSPLIQGAEPLLVNYLPVIDHPVFFVGLGLFFAGTLLQICRLPSMDPPADDSIPVAAALTWRAMAPIAAVAVVVFAASLWVTPADLDAELFWELTFWGGGHTFQVVFVLMMLGAWYALLADGRGRSPVGPLGALLVAGLLIVPWFAAPILPWPGTTDGTYIRGFTRLMQLGIAGPVVVAMTLCLKAWGRDGVSTAGRRAFAVSAALTIVGFGLGAAIRGDDTMIPAHYHASLGAITVALMALTYQLLEARGWTPDSKRWHRLASWQPTLFGAGQLLFAAGFGAGAAFGLDRKSYGSEQILDSAGAIVSTATMGLGGLVAAVGGLGFLWLVAVASRRQLDSNTGMYR